MGWPDRTGRREYLLAASSSFVGLASCAATPEFDGGSPDGGGGGEWEGTYEKPDLRNLGVELAAYDPDTGQAGALDFEHARSGDPPFLEFGAVVESGGGETKTLPTFEYRTVPDAEVFAPLTGTVSAREPNPDRNDAAIRFRPGHDGTDNPWYVEMDHVTGSTVSEGDEVSPGDTLGTAGKWGPNRGRTEILVGRYGEEKFYCPLAFMPADTRENYAATLSRIMADWEDHVGEDTYDEGSHWRPGCTERTIPQDEL